MGDALNSVSFRVRYEETDNMQVVYYGKYYSWFDVCRTELFRRLGFPYRDMEAQGLYLPVIEASCRYLAPARYDDWVTVWARPVKIGRVRVSLEYRVVLPDGTIAAEGGTTHAMIDRQGKLVRIPGPILDTLKQAAYGWPEES